VKRLVKVQRLADPKCQNVKPREQRRTLRHHLGRTLRHDEDARGSHRDHHHAGEQRHRPTRGVGRAALNEMHQRIHQHGKDERDHERDDD
jgi:hypothetical protein